MIAQKSARTLSALTDKNGNSRERGNSWGTLSSTPERWRGFICRLLANNVKQGRALLGTPSSC